MLELLNYAIYYGKDTLRKTIRYLTSEATPNMHSTVKCIYSSNIVVPPIPKRVKCTF